MRHPWAHVVSFLTHGGRGHRSLYTLAIALGIVGALFASSVAWAEEDKDEEAPPPQQQIDPAGVVKDATPITAEKTAIVNFDELARQPQATAVPGAEPKFIVPEEEQAPAEVGGLPLAPPSWSYPPSPRILAASPPTTTSYAGLDDIAMVDSLYIIIPPDVSGAVGQSKVIEAFNNNYRIRDKATGATLSTVGTATFWAPVVALSERLSLTDPRLAYDPYNDRWITVMQTVTSSAGKILLGVSLTNDPSGSWYLYSFNTALTIDFPNLGFNKNWISVAINRTTGSRGINLIVNYPAARTGTGSAVQVNHSSGHFCAGPAITYSATEETLFVVQHLSGPSATYELDTITGTPAAPVYTNGTTQTRTGGAWVAPTTANTLPQSAPSSGTSVCGATPCKIEIQDSYIRSAPIYRGGRIYYAQTIGLPSGTMTHTAAQWTKIKSAGGTFVDGGRIEDPTATSANGGKWYDNCHLTVNSRGDMILGYTQFSSAQHPSAGYSIHMAQDAAGSMRDPVIYHTGEDYYHKTFTTNTGRNRWGDFSTCQVDPADDLKLWTLQEYAKTRTSTNDGTTGSNGSRWASWWAGVTTTYNITASAGANGTISPNGTVTVTAGESQAFAITPAACYHVADVLVDGSSVGAVTGYTFSNVSAAHTIAASFAFNTYTVTASAGANGGITPSGAVSVNCGANQAFAIAPNTGYAVQDVLVDGSSVGAVTGYTFSNVTANHTITASFVSDGSVDAGPAAGPINNGTATRIIPVTITRRLGSPALMAFSVKFTASSPLTLPSGTASMVLGGYLDANGGRTTTFQTSDLGGGEYEADGATLGAPCGSTALTGTLFTVEVGASASGTGTITINEIRLRDCNNNDIVLNIGTASTVVADLSNPSVAVTAPNGGESWQIGSSHNITWTASDPEGLAGFDLAYSTDGGATYPHSIATGLPGTAVSYAWTIPPTATATAKVRVTAHDIHSNSAEDASDADFAITAFTITASAAANGSISPNGAVPVDYDADQAFAITPDAHYHVADVLVDGVSVGAVTGYTFTHVTADHTIHASFAIDTYTITASAGANGSIAPSGAVVVAYGADQAFAITANACYHIADVLVDGSSVGAVAGYTFTGVAANHTIAASFAIDTFTITASAGAHGGISPAGDTVVDCGGNQAYAISADACYHIADVLVDGVSVGAVAGYTFTGVVANHTIAASFAINTHTIAASAGAHGAISPAGDTVVDCGGEQAYTITADACYHIADVLVDGVSVGAVAGYTFSNVTANHTIAASFAIDTFTIAASAGAHGSITPSGDVTVDCGGEQAFAIAASSCYHIADVLVDGVSVGAVAGYTFTGVVANHTIAASFAIDTYTLAASAGAHGAISPAGDTVVDCGGEQAYTITADACYHIADVLVDGVSVGAVAGYTFTGVVANHTIAASFAIDTYTLAASAGAHGAISPAGDTVVDCGGEQAFAITANSCYHIADVLVDGISVGAVAGYTFSGVNANHTIAASFAINTYTIAASAGAHGAIAPAGDTVVDCGGEQAYTITADACYHIADVLVDGVSVGAVAGYTFSGVTANHTIAASFAPDSFSITASAGTGGSISPSGEVSVSCGGEQAFAITANSCYHIADVLVDGISVGAVAGYTFSGVNANHTIAASFAIDTYTIAASAGSHGSIAPAGDTVVNCGGEQAYAITADACYHIADVLVDGVSVGAVSGYTFSGVVANHTIAASFALTSYTITASAGAHGSITPSGAVSVGCGGEQVFAIAADGGYHISDVLVDGVSVGVVSGYTFSGVVANHTIAASFVVNPPVPAITNLAAAQVRTGNDPGSTTKVTLTFTAPAGTTVEVWRKGFGFYPEYDNAGGAVPSASATYPPGAGWTKTLVTTTGGTDLTVDRDYYYFVAYAQDGYGTWSPASNMTGGTLNYHLGDVSDGLTPGTGNNVVFMEDISLLGAHYGVTLGSGDPLGYLDVGPTTNHHVDGRPTTDSKVEFEDLVMFALNYSVVSKTTLPAADRDAIALDSPAQVNAGDVFDVTVLMSGTGAVQALSMSLSWDPAVVTPVSVTGSDFASANGAVVLSSKAGDVDAAVLGSSQGGFSGYGELARVQFRAIAGGAPNITVTGVVGRDSDNSSAPVAFGSATAIQSHLAPKTTELLPASPNPFNGWTTLRYRLSTRETVRLEVFSADGRMVRVLRNEEMAPGEYVAQWNGLDDRGQKLASGQYFARLQTSHGRMVSNMTLLR